MNLVSVIPQQGPNRRGLGNLGQYHHAVVHHTATVQVTAADIEREVASRGYVIQEAVVHHPPAVVTPTITLTKSMAIKIAVDEGINQLQVPHTTTHLYRCPTGTCPLIPNYYNLLISWSVTYANGLLTGRYTPRAWAQQMIHTGALRGIGRGGHLGGWLQDNPWVIQSVGDVVKNYGEYLTAQNVQDAIKQVEQNTKGTLSKDDIPALVAALTAGGYIDPKSQAAAAEGATAAASPSWMMPALVIGGGILFALLMGRK